MCIRVTPHTGVCQQGYKQGRDPIWRQCQERKGGQRRWRCSQAEPTNPQHQRGPRESPSPPRTPLQRGKPDKAHTGPHREMPGTGPLPAGDRRWRTSMYGTAHSQHLLHDRVGAASLPICVLSSCLYIPVRPRKSSWRAGPHPPHYPHPRMSARAQHTAGTQRTRAQECVNYQQEFTVKEGETIM